jgi:predicted transcriptional regulator
MTHEFATQLLAPYVDGALPLADASAVQVHLSGCPDCSADVLGLERLNRMLEFPPAPPVAFHRFWAGIEQALPSRRPSRVRVLRGSLALAFALACLLVVVTAASALAADRILPDSPLYPVKRVGESLRVDLTLTRHDRMRLRLALAAERLREAKAMAQARKNELAVASLKDFQSLLSNAEPALQHQVAADQQETMQQVAGLQQELTQVEAAATASPNAGDAQVEAIVQDSRASLTQVEQEASAPVAAEPTPTPEPSSTPASQPTPEPQDTASN